MAFAIPLIGLAGSVIGSALSKPKTVQPVAQPQATPRGNSVIADALAARRGTGINQVTGAGGIESSTTAKKSLMGQ